MTQKQFNILLLNETSGPGGAETVLYNIASNLNRNQFNPSVVLFRPGWFYDFLVEHGIQVKIIDSHRSWDISFLLKLIKYCRQYKIDLIHADLPGGNLYGSITGKIIGIPVICTFHNEVSLPGANERFSNAKYFIIRNLASRLVFVADYMKNEYLVKAGFPLKKCLTIYNGASDSPRDDYFDIEAFRNEIDFHDGEFLIANVANFRVPKGHEILIEAARQVCAKIRKAKFLLIGDEGDGKIMNRVKHLIDKHQLQDNVKILGFRNDIPQILKNIDLFILASISEGLPVSVVEGMMAACPVIATKVGGLSEVVKSGETGYVVNPGNPAALAEVTLELLTNPALRRDMGQKGRQLAMNLFSLENMILKYQQLYLELLQ